jgi:hypothetical protein
MRFKLHGERGTFEIPAAEWKRVLELARAYGWKPEGTDPPDIRDQDDDLACDWSGWSGSYAVREYQHVRAEDAARLAEALDLALLDIPLRSVIERDAPGVFSGVRGASLHAEPKPIEWFYRPTRRAELVRLVEFCRTGGFQIG